MSLTLTFALSQNQAFELRCSHGTRRLDTAAMTALINLCEEKYYNQDFDSLSELKKIGRELYQWLDGKEGWLRRRLEDDDDRKIYLDLIQTSETQALNPQTQKVALELAHLPWELLHDGSRFLLLETNLLPVRKVQDVSIAIIINFSDMMLFMMANNASILKKLTKLRSKIFCPIKLFFQKMLKLI